MAATLLAANAEVPAPQLFNGACLYALSPDGKMAASELWGTVMIINLATGDIDEYEFDDEVYPIHDYTVGHGQCVSNNGIVVGGTGSSDASYWKGGDWLTLGRGKATGNCVANAITHDGSRICGSIGLREIDNGEDALMQVPVVWDWDGDDFGEPVILPHPTLDIVNKIPQYCNAVDISADGKTVVGFVMDSTGFMCYPIVYREDASGNWSYEIVHPELLNPNGIVIPEYPGEWGEIPMIDNYMTEEQIEAFYKAVNQWSEEHEGMVMDYFDMFYLAEEFMDAEQYALLSDEMIPYMEWFQDMDEWHEIYDQICAESPGYDFNSAHMAPDGSAFSINVTNGSPYVFSLVSDKYTHYTQFGQKNVSYFASEGRLIVYDNLYSGHSWIIENDGQTDIYEWISAKEPSFGNWMQEYNFLNGIATGTPDLSTVGFWQLLGDDSLYVTRSVIFDFNDGSGVETNAAAPSSNGRAFDINGRPVKDTALPGIYIVDGKKVMVTK